MCVEWPRGCRLLLSRSGATHRRWRNLFLSFCLPTCYQVRTCGSSQRNPADRSSQHAAGSDCSLHHCHLSGSIGGESNFTGGLERKHAEDQCRRKVGQYVCFWRTGRIRLRAGRLCLWTRAVCNARQYLRCVLVLVWISLSYRLLWKRGRDDPFVRCGNTAIQRKTGQHLYRARNDKRKPDQLILTRFIAIRDTAR